MSELRIHRDYMTSLGVRILIEKDDNEKRYVSILINNKPADQAGMASLYRKQHERNIRDDKARQEWLEKHAQTEFFNQKEASK